ncbi:MAG: 6-bladed beta-propeller, partial [Rhodothermaceae bacterium]|nr:6-bladed beta-propeller [Rhodothermaceae bacterium]MYI84259.1 6-bladed beta-propeller [Rhodothermaceae bacterium]
MQFNNRPLTCVLLIALLAVCSDQESSGQPSEVGQVDVSEVLRLGDEAAGDTVLFSQITHLAVNNRGDIIVEESRRPSIRAFNSEGAYVNDIGGVGQGPGEYRYTWGVVAGPADSVYVWEVYTDRVMVYDPNDFSFVRHVTVEDDGIKGAVGIIGIGEAGWIMPIQARP